MPSFFGFKNIVNKEYIERIKKYNKSKSEFTESIKNAKSTENVKESAVKNDVDKDEFSKRYKYGQINCAVVALAFIFSFVMMISSTSALSFLIAAFGLFFSSAVYFRYAYELWRARVVASKWSQRNKILTTTYGRFIKAIIKKPSNIIPIRIEFK